jgi:hypothetical protein
MSKLLVVLIILTHSKKPVWHGYMTLTSIVKDITSTKIIFLWTRNVLQLSKSNRITDLRGAGTTGKSFGMTSRTEMNPSALMWGVIHALTLWVLM